ncbi:MAG: ABC transporter ATP-binding protein [Pirellulales bacterium]|jgi:ABC-2 type transport system ATP-binding protein|nr:ABC transporter ATP-binding protein [Thermoguttaceae bacterium]MDD4787961.1 ABC transporter ATP-binding protein [Pirellulales bacterium]MDI9445313.1 ABC transporter ATP-binding protein [Planctomycetota bacterium]NLZ00791.1 ABC transporter ATP-binding protein [Pirellulaceae bacterium]
MIQFHRVTRKYGHKTAVCELDLAVSAGELFAFLGPNGAGKTTTIKMLSCLLRPTEGSITVCGHDTVRSPREAARNVGYVPDEPHLYDKLSGREFLEFVARMHGLGSAQTEDRIERESDRFAMRDFLCELTETYSHGMKQRLVFAAALIHDPAVLVVDEPMVGLDPKSVRMVKDLFRAATRRGTAVFMSTHTLSVAEELADRIAIIDAGRLRFLGALEDLGRQTAGDHGSLEHLFLELTNGNGRAPEDLAARSESDGCARTDDNRRG